MSGFRYEVQTQETGERWFDNSVVLATEAEAQGAGYDKWSRWALCTAYRVVPVDATPNYTWDALRGLQPIPGAIPPATSSHDSQPTHDTPTE